MVDVAESEVVIDSLMEQLPGLFSETRETETILGPVIQVHSFSLSIPIYLTLSRSILLGPVIQVNSFSLLITFINLTLSCKEAYKATECCGKLVLYQNNLPVEVKEREIETHKKKKKIYSTPSELGERDTRKEI